MALNLRDLRAAGCVTSRREGRRTFYSVVPEKPMRTDYLWHHTVGQLLGLLAAAESSRKEDANQAPGMPLAK